MTKRKSYLIRSVGLVAIYLGESLTIALVAPQGILMRLNESLERIFKFIDSPASNEATDPAIAYATTMLTMDYLALLVIATTVLLWESRAVIARKVIWFITLVISLLGVATMTYTTALHYHLIYERTRWFQSFTLDILTVIAIPLIFYVAVKILWQRTKLSPS